MCGKLVEVSTLPFVTLLTMTCVNSFVEFWILCIFLWCRGEVNCNRVGKLVGVAHDALFVLVVVYFWILCIVLWYRGWPNCKGRVVVGECMSRSPITLPSPFLCDCSCFRPHHMSSPLLSLPLSVAHDWPGWAMVAGAASTEVMWRWRSTKVVTMARQGLFPPPPVLSKHRYCIQHTARGLVVSYAG